MPVVNLNKIRKSKARTDKKVRATENVLKFGRTKAEKQKDAVQNTKARRFLDLHKRDHT